MWQLGKKKYAVILMVFSLVSIGIYSSHQAFADHGQSQAVVPSLAFQYHQAEIYGSPVSVGIIDAGFTSNNPQFEGNVISAEAFGFCFTIACGNVPGDSHGDAVAEIIVDMAPSVDLRLYSVVGIIGFENAVDKAIADGVNIINISLDFPGTGFFSQGGDGSTGWFRDGTSSAAKKINEANQAGILVVVASGNLGHHWTGNYIPSSISPIAIGLLTGYQSLLEFQPTASGKQKVCLPVVHQGTEGDFIATWSEWTDTNDNYDFFIFDKTMTNFLASSKSFQTFALSTPPHRIYFGK